MKNTVYLVVVLLLLSLVPMQVESDGHYTIWVKVTRDGQLQENATVTFTNLANNQTSPTFEQGGGFYGTNLVNINWDYGDTVLVEATYGAYTGSNSTVLTHQGSTYGDWLNITLLADLCPDRPSNPTPVDNATDRPLNVTLSVDVHDDNGDAMDVTFYNASSDTEIGTVTDVPSDGTASIAWTALAFNTTYAWYAVADDGTSTNQSATWQFTTRQPGYYTLNVSAHPSGTGSFTVSPDNDTYVEGTMVNVTATPIADYRFDHWDVNGTTSTDNPLILVMDGDKNVTGHFTPVQYTLHTGVDPSGSGSVSRTPPGSSYDNGTTVTLEADAGTGYLFSNWSGDLTGTSNPDTVTMNANKSVTAHFIVNQPPGIAITSPMQGAVVSGTIMIQGTASDPNGDDTIQDVKIKIGQGSWTTASGTTSWQHTWDSTSVPDGNHTIHARVSDGQLSNTTLVNVTVNNNHPPAAPSVDGPVEGQTNTSYTFSATSSDPDNDTLRYGFDWDDDGTADAWTGFLPSGETATCNHTWTVEGTHTIRAVAKDEHGVQSNWSTTHSIVIGGQDTVPPNASLVYGAPSANLSHDGSVYPALAPVTPVWVNATDGNGTGAAAVNVTVWWNSTTPGNHTRVDTMTVGDNDANDSDPRTGVISVELHLDDGGFYRVAWNATDYAGNPSMAYAMDIAVDNTSPMLNTSVGEPSYEGPGLYGAGNWTWLNCSTPVWLNVTDRGCCGGVGVARMDIQLFCNEKGGLSGQVQNLTGIGNLTIYDNGPLDRNGSPGIIAYNVSFWREGYHALEIETVDHLNNSNASTEQEMVDCSPPTSRVRHVVPFEQRAPFNVTVTDAADATPQGAGVETLALLYAYSQDNVTFSDWRCFATWNVSTASRAVPNWTVSFDPDQGHGYYRLASRASDHLGHVEPISGYDTVCYNNASLSLTFGEPYHDGWISLSTPVTISTHVEPEPAIYYRIYNNGSWRPAPGDGVGDNASFYRYNGSFTLAAHGCTHGNGTIMFYGNGTAMGSASFMLDTRPPSVEQTGGTSFLVCDNISLDVVCGDAGSGVATVDLYANYSIDNMSWNAGAHAGSDGAAPFSFSYGFPAGAGFYRFSFRAVDEVGNTAATHPGAPTRFFSPDVNGDGAVNIQDLVCIGSYWQAPLDQDTHKYDINGDGVVNRPDIDIVARYLP
jgi:hypothetical protein